MTTNPVAVYIHIPFCHHRCSYCDFNIYAGMKSLYTSYAEAVTAEIASNAARVGRMRVPSIYFGGGTPSLLPAELIGGLMTALRMFFDVDDEAEVTLEANPGKMQDAGSNPTGALRGMQEADFAQLRMLGVNRLSLGVQSSHEAELHLLRRGHSFAEAVATYEAARRAGFENVNLDLIYGLPDQSIEKWRATLERVIALRPDHISAYSLQIEPRTAMLRWVQNGRVPEPDEDDVAAMYELAQEMLAQAAFEHYEISNWARCGRQEAGGNSRNTQYASRHNLVYWRNELYFGFGCGAHSSVAGKRYSNVLHPREYIAHIQQKGDAIVEVEEIDRTLEMGETLMLGLRLIEKGVERSRFKDRFGVELAEVYGATIEKLVLQDLLHSDSEGIRLTPRGRLLGNRVFAEFLP
jgi:oxygen-independent coproporphyrinogen-3 oxidase